MKNRIKLKTPVIKSRAEMEALVREIAELTLARNKEQIELDEAITAIKERYEVTLGNYGKALEEKTECARAWAEANPSEFNGLKSLDLTHGVVGWRIGNPQLKPLTGWTWDRVLEKLKSLVMINSSFADFIRLKEEVNKQQILAGRDNLMDADLRNMGVRVVQEESFYVEPKITEPQNRQTVEAA